MPVGLAEKLLGDGACALIDSGSRVGHPGSLPDGIGNFKLKVEIEAVFQMKSPRLLRKDRVVRPGNPIGFDLIRVRRGQSIRPCLHPVPERESENSVRQGWITGGL